ncbi:hypothetical protein lbkm_2076 [Lachnospiraceae bacterium KM106-2]|nr:hypothetical protein lbkm_2076 [Lachnospiraceae bacterium KM106-2]
MQLPKDCKVYILEKVKKKGKGCLRAFRKENMKRRYFMVVCLILCFMICSCKNTPLKKVNSKSDKATVKYQLIMDNTEWNKYDTKFCGSSSKSEFLQQGEKYLKEMEKITGLHDWYKKYHKKRLDIKVTLEESNMSQAHSFNKSISLNAYYFKYGLSPYAHELGHLFAGLNCISSLSEGFACYLSDKVGCVGVFNYGINPHELATVYISDKKYTDILNAIGVGEPPSSASSTNQDTTYRTAYYICSDSFCTYLIDTYGMEKFIKFYKDDCGNDSYTLVYKKTVNDLKAEWKNYIKNYPVQLTRKQANQQVKKVLIKHHFPVKQK